MSGFALLNGVSLYYEKEGSGKTIVFIHGLGLDCRMWDEQFYFLSRHFQVVRYDLRGFGKSSLPGEQSYSHHHDLHELLNYLQISTACLIGLSMGGRVAVDFALSFPGMTASLVLVDAALHGYNFKTFSLKNVYAIAKEKGVKEANIAWQKHELFDATNKNTKVANAITEIITSYSGWHWINKNPWKPLDPPSIQQLNKLRMPTLIIVGEHDLPDFHSIADILLQNIPASKKIVIPKVGHMSNIEDPLTFNKVVADFLDAN